MSDDTIRIGKQVFAVQTFDHMRINPADFPPEVWAEIEATRAMTADQLAASYMGNVRAIGIGAGEVMERVSAMNTLAQRAIQSVPERFERMPAHRLRLHAFSAN